MLTSIEKCLSSSEEKMSKKFINAYEIRQHKSLNKEWINCFDAYSSDLTAIGVLSKDVFWQKEMPNQSNEEIIFMYGVNSSEQVFKLRLKTKPIYDNKTDRIICIQYRYKIYLKTGTDNQYSCDETGISYKISECEYKFPGLLIQVLEPFMKWRIKFNGLLLDNNNDKVFVKLRMLWVSNAEVFDYRTNCDNNYLTKQTNGFKLTVDDIFEHRYVGSGNLKALFKVNNDSEKELFFWGTRSKATKVKSDKEFQQNFNKSILMAYSEKGIALEVIKITSKDDKSLYYGWALAPHGTVFPIEEMKIDRISVEKLNPFPNSFKLKINSKYLSADGLQLHQNGTVVLNINGHKSVGLLIDDKTLFDDFEPIVPNMDLYRMFTSEESDDLVVNFEDKTGTNELITGGKGSSLCLLKGFSYFKDNEFVVPNGFIITTNAYKMILKENPKLEQTIDEFQTNLWSQKELDIQTECQNLMALFTSVEMPSVVKSVIEESLSNFDKNGNFNDILVAVRSSACGEDSEDMSAAGQMTTYLGVKGLDNICDAVLKCWSSQFSLIAVEYKRGYGQAINTPMAVVVQEMIDCDVAGVMFTCDPINGDLNKIIINANFGIGESVVSATVNPDNISLLVDMESNSLESKRSIHSIDKIIIGAKESAIKLSNSEDFGTEIQTNFNNKDKCCLNEEEIIKLGEIGLKIQEYFGCVRDIEWGLKEGRIYLFQSRPVTNLNSFNEWELSHEFDTGHLDETEYNTKANLGEVMPGALSPLTITTLLRTMFLENSVTSLDIHGFKYNPFRKSNQTLTIHNYSGFFSLKDASFFDFAPEKYETFFQRALVLAVFGHQVEEEQLKNDALERNGIPTFKTKLIKQKDALSFLISGEKLLRSKINEYQDLNLLDGRDFETSKQMFDFVSKYLYIPRECFKAHMAVSAKSSVNNLFLLTILSNGDIDIKSKPELLTDFANVLSNTGKTIVSADVPKALYNLAKSIENPDVFKDMSDEYGLEWLENNKEETGKLYQQFMKNYGFRGYKEWDVNSKTWADNKPLLVTTLKNMLPLKQNQTEDTMSLDQLIDRIKSPVSKFKKFLLKKWVLPATYKGVALREESKSFIIGCVDRYRKFFREMSKVMCFKEGRIPEPDLIFFLTLHELKVLTEFRDPKIVMKAKQRKRIYQKLDKYIYNEMSVGPDIKPRNYLDKSSLKTKYLNGPNCLLTGTPVCTGSVTARVCVAKNIDEAKSIQSGDILVTYSTDIGWSPYLPLISGIITEIGGLVSHGAVIAREYGIPCLVGVDNACEMLSTGETVLLDADNAQIVLMRTKN